MLKEIMAQRALPESSRTLMSKALLGAFIFCSLLLLPVVDAAPAENGLSFGYGFGLFNSSSLGKLRAENGSYNSLQLGLSSERPFYRKLKLVLEPSMTHVNVATEGMEGGLSLLARYYLQQRKEASLFVTLGTGAEYTSVSFVEQGTHLLFLLQGGIGYRWKDFYVENRFRHLSNPGPDRPNRPTSSNIISVGIIF
jgi:hypothetical protein